ncbi:MAG: pseudouridine synthase [Planctomycetota bacterium]|nr:pseudouridine synthase [Planctomycetota bacterium]
MAKVRLQKLISAAGLASRRKAEEWILEGRVRVNGKVIRTLGSVADPETDSVKVGSTAVRSLPRKTIALHKPSGFLTTTDDPQKRRTVLDLLPRPMRRLGLRPVGRLDRDAEGLLLLTNDGALAQRIAHPSSGCEKEYHVRVKGRLSAATRQKLQKGIRIDGRRTAPCKVALLREGRETTEISIVLQEGRNRQLKKMLSVVGHHVERLRRVRIGRLRLGRLPRGAWRNVPAKEIGRHFPTETSPQ